MMAWKKKRNEVKDKGRAFCFIYNARQNVYVGLTRSERISYNYGSATADVTYSPHCVKY